MRVLGHGTFPSTHRDPLEKLGVRLDDNRDRKRLGYEGRDTVDMLSVSCIVLFLLFVRSLTRVHGTVHG